MLQHPMRMFLTWRTNHMQIRTDIHWTHVISFDFSNHWMEVKQTCTQLPISVFFSCFVKHVVHQKIQQTVVSWRRNSFKRKRRYPVIYDKGNRELDVVINV